MILTTPWSADVEPDHPLPEYPRPQLTRPEWLNLNGRWDYAILPSRVERVEAFDGQIVVPFAVESALSGVQKPLKPDQRLWYRRTFQVPSSWSGNRILLHFGAVDWQCEVWVNGQPAGNHTGGYLPFSLDITSLLRSGENELCLAVSDPTESGLQECGKQSLRPRMIWYTAVSGIWQTVWLEPVPEKHIRSLRLTPDLANGQLDIAVDIDPMRADLSLEATASFNGQVVAQATATAGTAIKLKIEEARPWSPENPNLYQLQVRLQQGGKCVDEVGSYFAMRSFGFGMDARGQRRFLLNNQPTFLYGPLDQGYWPDGLYTAPTDEALRFDIEYTKDIGCNLIRKHVKVEPARWYYHCDQLGMIVWQDMPNGGYPPNGTITLGPLLFGRSRSDEVHLERFGRANEGKRLRFLEDLGGMIAQLYNTACIAAWVPFNEGWGQFNARKVTDQIHAWDPTRSVDQASGWFDQGGGDWRSLHIYGIKLRDRRPDSRAFVLSEIGGYGLRVDGHTLDPKRKFGVRFFKDSGALTSAYAELLRTQLEPLIAQGLAAAIYTQTTDVEIEINGWLTYDRRVEKISRESLRAMHAKLFAYAQMELLKGWAPNPA
jgi:beta-galactosidase/beta-glucuronidase